MANADKHLCAYPGCTEPGEYPAPQDPRRLNERVFFCLPHVKAYNASWNGLDGFSSDEIFNMQHGGAHWNRPTWRMGADSPSFKKATFSAEDTRDPFRFFEESTAPNQRTGGGDSSTQGTFVGSSMPGQIREACETLAVQPPLDRAAVKRQYRTLARKFHPDLNQDTPGAEDRLKRINAAYKVLLAYLDKQDASR